MPSPPAQNTQPSMEAGFLRYRSTGSPSGLTEALQGVRPELIRIAQYQLRQREAAEDVVQATLLTAIEQAQAFDPERRLIPWLCGILQNKISSHRRRQRRVYSDVDQDRLLAPNPHKVVAAREAQALVGHALAQLPKHYRDVLDLHLNQGLGGGEIATRLHRPEGTIRAQIHRGLIRLRHLLPAGLATGFLLTRSSRLQAQGASQAKGSSLARVWRALGLTRAGLTCLALGLGALVWFLQLPADRSAEPQSERVAAIEFPSMDSPLSPGAQAKPGLREVSASANMTPDRSVGLLGSGPGLRVNVLDLRGGQPASGAKVFARITDLDGQSHTFEEVSDSDGHISLAFPPDQILHLSVSAEGRDASRARSRWDLNGTRFDSTIPLEVHVIEHRELGGRVLDEAGQPVPQARVQLRLTEFYNDHEYRRITEYLAAETDSDGYWSIPDAPAFPTHFKFNIFHPRFISQLSNNQTRQMTPEDLWAGNGLAYLEAGIPTTLRVTDQSGAALAGAHARIVEGKDPFSYGIEMQADESGLFSFSVRPGKQFILTAGAPGFGQDEKRFAAQLAGSHLQWPIEQRPTRRIRVIDSRGEGLPGVLVRPFTHSWEESLTSDADGYVSLALRQEFWTLFQIQRPDTLGMVNHLVRPGDQTIQMPSPVEFELVVLDAFTGEPLTDYRATVYHPGRWRRGQISGQETATPLHIRFHPEPHHPKKRLPDRSIHVAIEHQGYLSFDSGELHAKGFPARIVARLVPADSIDLTLLNPDGSPALESILVFAKPGQRATLVQGEIAITSLERPHTQRLHRGRAKITPPAGDYALMASNDEGYLRISRRELAALGASPVLRFQAWACIEGSSPRDEVVKLQSADGSISQFDLNDKNNPTPDGRFHFCYVPSGSMRLSIVNSDLEVLVQSTAGSTIGPILMADASEENPR